jgi:RNA polymerase sigma-70 factor (ECF subfamily)
MADRDPQAFRELYRRHYAAVCRYLAARTDRAYVEDLAAETFLVAWRRQPELPDEVRPWLLNTAGKCLANHRRSRQRAAALAERLAGLAAPELPGLEPAVARGMRSRALLAAVASLGLRDREVVLLHHWDGLAPREIARVLGVTPVIARARLHRAGRRLERSLAHELAGAELPLTIQAREEPT